MATSQKAVKIGDYTILQRLGAGGFSNVYKAVDPKGSFVAIKVPHPHIRQNEKIRQKINDEVVSMSRLNHPNITKLYRFLYPCNIVMEYIDGKTLKDCLDDRDRPLTLEHKIQLSKQAIDAFQYAFEMGVLHRDIKSSNLMIDRIGNVKIMDFGIAKISSSATSDTAAQMLSFQYAAPERYTPGKTIDVRSDIYSFGVVLYEIFSGKQPFDVEDTQQLIYCHLNEKPESLDTTTLSPHINAAVMKALEKDPDQRFDTFEALGNALLTNIEDYMEVEDQTQFITSLYKTAELVEALKNEEAKRTVEIERTADRSKTSSAQQFGASFTNSVTTPVGRTMGTSQKVTSPKVDLSSWNVGTPEEQSPRQFLEDFSEESENGIAAKGKKDTGGAAGKDSRLKTLLSKKKILAGITGLILIIAGAFPVFHPATRSATADRVHALWSQLFGKKEISGELTTRINEKGFQEVKHPKDGSWMVFIPAGMFIKGSDQYDETPQQKQFLDSYFIDKYLVTNQQFEMFVNETKYVTQAEKAGYGMVKENRWKRQKNASWRKPDGILSIEGKETYPVTQIAYDDAAAYCKWAGKEVPTEDQWEKAARGPDGNIFPWGNSDPDDSLANYGMIYGSTSPVDAYKKGQSYYGVHDMAGNVWQWCQDQYVQGSDSRVVKGGSFLELGEDIFRSSYRDRYSQTNSRFNFGFRCSCSEIKP